MTATLAALGLFLSGLEYMIPKPLPFLRLGLANAPLLLALPLPPASFFLLAAAKVLGQALMSGTLVSYVFPLSLCGTAVSAAAMFLLRRAVPATLLSLTGVSVAGAFLSNLTQIALARFLFLGEGAVYLVPPFLAAGLVSGTALGLFCARFAAQSRWYKAAMARELGLTQPETAPTEADSTLTKADSTLTKADAPLSPTRLTEPASPPPKRKPPLDTEAFPAPLLFTAGLVMGAALLLNGDSLGRAAQFLVFLTLALLCGRAGNVLVTAVVFTAVVGFNLLVPYGRVLRQTGIPLTEGALLGGIGKAATLEGLIMLSRVTISPRLRLPGRVGALIGDAFRLLPQLAALKGAIRPKTFVRGLDNALLSLAAPTVEETEPSRPMRIPPLPAVVLALFMLAALALSIPTRLIQ
jgi:heptaprenyl diphosphate synthase